MIMDAVTQHEIAQIQCVCNVMSERPILKQDLNQSLQVVSGAVRSSRQPGMTFWQNVINVQMMPDIFE